MNALELLIDKKVQRVLTSGTPLASCTLALEVVANINLTIAQANGRIEVVVGGGITSDNVLLLLENMLLGEMLSEKLKRCETLVSLHSYSGLCHEGLTAHYLVNEVVEKIQHYIYPNVA